MRNSLTIAQLQIVKLCFVFHVIVIANLITKLRIIIRMLNYLLLYFIFPFLYF